MPICHWSVSDYDTSVLYCRLISARTMLIDQRWRCSLYDPFWRLYRNRHAGGVLISEDGEVAMEPGDCLVLPAWSRYRTRCVGAVRHDYFHFDPIGLPGSWVRSHCLRLVRLGRRPEWDSLIDQVPIDDRSDWGTQLQAQALVCAALTAYLAAIGDSQEAASPDDARGQDRELIMPAVHWIENHLRDPLPVGLLADRCGINRDRFTRTFIRAIGSPPARHVAERRISAAAHLLITTDQPIDEVATTIGFANRYHFSRVFHRILGISPAAYRRQGRFGK